jgi:serine/threonine protein phosphatase PrpC
VSSECVEYSFMCSPYRSIISAGGHVEGNRVNGTLGVARSLGDFYLHPAISDTPHIRTVPYPNAASAWVVLACDGLFDELSDARVGQILHGVFNAGDAATLLRDAAYLLNSDDNISVIALRLIR